MFKPTLGRPNPLLDGLPKLEGAFTGVAFFAPRDMPDGYDGAVAGADVMLPNPFPEEGAGVYEEDDGPADDNPPPPNLAAIRAFASSRSLVCRRTYCSSVSPVKRSIPFRSSPGRPVASWSEAPPLEGAELPNEVPEEGADMGLYEEDDGPADDNPPPPNLAAILAFASSRSLV